MIRFKRLSKNSLKIIYSFLWLSIEEGTIEIDTNTTKCTLLTSPDWMNERDKEKILYISSKHLKEYNYPQAYTYATH